jgi:hypothetical protein
MSVDDSRSGYRDDGDAYEEDNYYNTDDTEECSGSLKRCILS